MICCHLLTGGTREAETAGEPGRAQARTWATLGTAGDCSGHGAGWGGHGAGWGQTHADAGLCRSCLRLKKQAEA